MKRKIIIVIVALVLAGAGSYWFFAIRSNEPIPANVRSKVSFPLLYPSKLPQGFSIDQKSFSVQSGVVLYSANNPTGDKVAFSVQPRPATFAFDTFYKQGLNGASTFDTPLGQAAVGQANGQPIGSLATDQSWLLISSVSKKVGSSALRQILQSVKLAH